MHSALLPLLAAPGGGPLSLTVVRQDGAEILEGCLVDSTGRAYPIEEGIPRLLPPALLEAQQAEMSARDTQAADYDRMAFLRAFGRIEIPLTRRALGAGPEDRLLEAGCGTGRMTRTLAAAVRELIAVDFSFESLRANRRKLRAAGVANVHLIQADLCRLPLAGEVFDRALSCQVLEHVPGGAARGQAVAEIRRVLRAGGLLTLSAYKHSLLTRLFACKEGAHKGGIPYFRFTRAELRSILETAFVVQSLTGILVYIYLARCTKR